MNKKLTELVNSPKRYLQYLPLALVFFIAMTGWFNLKADVQSQEVKANISSRIAEESRERLKSNEDTIQELRTQGAVVANTLKQIMRTQDEYRQDIKDILSAVR
jgi:septal ring factor EnvC (AmiA/AmiB activator)